MRVLLILTLLFFVNSQEKRIKHRTIDLVPVGEIHSNNVKAIVANNGCLFRGDRA